MSAAAGPRVIPQPVEYLDPLSDVDGCYYYAVPKYFGHGHPSTRWLVTMILQGRTDRVLRKMELKPRLFKEAYYQLADDPKLYWGKQTNEHPVFHRQAVLYFTTVAAAVYLGHDSFVETMLKYRDNYNDALHSVASEQYATHVHDTLGGDLHAFTLATVMLRCCRFACAVTLLRHGWDPLAAVAMPVRRRHERRALHFADWLDQALWLLAERSTYPLSALVLAMARDPLYWRHSRMPLAQLLGDAKAREQGGGGGGMVDVDELPVGAPPLLGVKSLADLVKDFGRFQQAKQLHMDMQQQVRRATALGANPERLLAQCQDFSAAFQRPQTTESGDTAGKAGGTSSSSSPHAAATCSTGACRNNSSAKRPKPPTPAVGVAAAESSYASEPVRILHYALERDRHGKSTRQCLAAVDVYIRRGFYLTTGALPAGGARQRDVRNAAVLLLNLVQRNMAELALLGSNRSGANQSRRLACLRMASRLVQLLSRMLIHSKEFAGFILREEFPPYLPGVAVDFAYAPGLAFNYADIRLSVAQQFNADPESGRHLTLADLQRLRATSGLRLRLKLGQPPRAGGDDELDNSSEEATRCGGKKKKTKKKSNRNCCNNAAVAAAAGSSCCACTEAERLQSRWTPQPQVTFVRVAAAAAAAATAGRGGARRSSTTATEAAVAAAPVANTAWASDTADGTIEALDASTMTAEADTEAEPTTVEDEPTVSATVEATTPPMTSQEEEEEEVTVAAEPEQQQSRNQHRSRSNHRGQLGGVGRWLAGLGRRTWHRVRVRAAAAHEG